MVKSAEEKSVANPIPMNAKVPMITTGADVVAIVPANVKEMMELAEYLAKSEMIPKRYQGKPQDIVVGIMFGMELGLKPLASLRHTAIINGTPALYGDGQLGVVMGKGQVAAIRESIEGDNDAMRATCSVQRKGMVDPTVQRFSVADAKRAGLWNKAGPWTQYPKRMLQFRARSFALRDAFPDLLLGLSAEEVEDVGIGPDHARDITPAPTAESRLDAMEATIAGEPEAPMPTDTAFGLPMTWPAPTADRKAWNVACIAAAKEIEALPDAAAAEAWEQLNGDALNDLMAGANKDFYNRLMEKLQAKKDAEL